MTQHLTNETLIDYMHGALTPQEDAAVYAHMETCDVCRSEYDAEVTLSEMLRAQAQREERELPPMLKAELWQRIREEQPSPASRFLGWFRPAFAVPIAAAIALGVYFGVGGFSQGAPSIEAAYYLQDHAALNSTIPFNDHGSASPVDLENGAANTQQVAVKVESAATYTADATP